MLLWCSRYKRNNKLIWIKPEIVNSGSRTIIYTIFVLQRRGAFLKVIAVSVFYKVTASTRIEWLRWATGSNEHLEITPSACVVLGGSKSGNILWKMFAYTTHTRSWAILIIKCPPLQLTYHYMTSALPRIFHVRTQHSALLKVWWKLHWQFQRAPCENILKVTHIIIYKGWF